ncbi:hypothetical protein K502DRAFT_365321 [Neoconidiobolus thromboides FSU 785]|nr:hypothetical protein K502DRAFT_365321 [Neoconidiobolus thromboides FSU 785]
MLKFKGSNLLYSINLRIISATLIALSLFQGNILGVSNDTQDLNLTPVDKEASRSCGGFDLYCSPQENDSWAVNDIHLLKWNKDYPSIQTNGLIDISLYISDNSRDPIFTRKDLQNKDGTFSVKITKAQFYQFDSNLDGKNTKGPIRKSAWFVIKSSSSSSNDVSSKGPNFNIIDPNPPIPSSTSTETTMTSKTKSTSTPSSTEVNNGTFFATPTNDQGNIDEKQPSNELALPIYGIVLLALAGLILLLIPLIVIWRRKSKKAKMIPENTEKSYIINGGKNGGVGARRLGSTSSAGFGMTGSRSSALTTDSVSPISLNQTNLTANDAIMLSETFREMMRKPSWSQNETGEEETPELDEHLNESNNISSIRLEEELALQGIGLHELDSKKNLTIIHDVKEDNATSSKPVSP